MIMNFNPRTHVGCDIGGKYAYLTILISIHAPTWGATILEVCSAMSKAFQSTHPRGVRLGSPIEHTRKVTNFNPRTHVGCDNYETHTLSVFSNFNPRTHVGCDTFITPLSFDFMLFQSTHPRGVRLQLGVVAPVVMPISIHAPTWGATKSCSVTIASEIFQSTHPRGVRQAQVRQYQEAGLFQSTHPRGVRLVVLFG